MDLIEQIERGDYSLVRVYKRERGIIMSAEAPDVHFKLLRLARLGAVRDTQTRELFEELLEALDGMDGDKKYIIQLKAKIESLLKEG
jgi:molybdate-binding protein